MLRNPKAHICTFVILWSWMECLQISIPWRALRSAFLCSGVKSNSKNKLIYKTKRVQSACYSVFRQIIGIYLIYPEGK